MGLLQASSQWTSFYPATHTLPGLQWARHCTPTHSLQFSHGNPAQDKATPCHPTFPQLARLAPKRLPLRVGLALLQGLPSGGWHRARQADLYSCGQFIIPMG